LFAYLSALMHGQFSIRLEALFSANERGFYFLDREKGEGFNLLSVGSGLLLKS
jgi:hypothetical protein